MTDIEITPNHEEDEVQEEAVEVDSGIEQLLEVEEEPDEDEGVEGEGDIPVEPSDPVAPVDEPLSQEIPKPEPILADPFEIAEEYEDGPLEKEVKVAASEYSASQLETAHKFLNKYGIRTDKLSDEQVIEKLRKIQDAKTVAAQVLSRGRVVDTIDRILDYVPEGMIGEFKRDNDLDISRAKALKWEVFIDEKAKLESATGTSDGTVKLGDLILMVIPEEIYVGTRLARADRLAERRKIRKSKERNPSQGDQVMGADPLVPVIQL